MTIKLKPVYITTYQSSGAAVGSFQPANASQIKLDDQRPLLEHASSVRLTYLNPTALSDATNSVRMKIDIRKFGNIRSCRVVMIAALVRRP